MRTLALIVFWLAMLAVGPAMALDPEDQLDDPALEARAREISRDLRCMQCQSQSIDDSNAPVAKALRELVRERLVAGDTNDEVIATITARYGDYVLLKPRFSAKNLGLWLGPVVVLILGGFGAFVFLRGHRKALGENAPLSERERAALDEAMRQEDA